MPFQKWMILVLLAMHPVRQTQTTLRVFDKWPSVEENLSQCLVAIAGKYFAKDLPLTVLTSKEVLSIDSNSYIKHGNGNILIKVLIDTLKIPVESIDYQNKNLTTRNKPGAFIIMISGEDISFILMEFYKMYYSLAGVISRHSIVVMAVDSTGPLDSPDEEKDLAERLLRIMWDGIKITDAIVVIPSLESSSNTKYKLNTFNVFNWDPKKQRDSCFKSLNRIEIFDTWIVDNKTFAKNANLFPNKYKTDLHGCKLRGLIYTYPHYAYYIESPKGAIFESLRIIGNKTNFSMGYNFERINSMPDLVFPVIYETDKNAFPPQCSLTYPHHTDRIRWYVPSGAPIPRWKSLALVFSTFMWIFVAITFILGSLAYWLLLSRSNKSVKFGSVFFDILSTYVEVSIPDKHKGTVAKSFFITWLFYCMIITSVYRSGLIGFLADPGEYEPINSLEQLNRSGLKMFSAMHVFQVKDKELKDLTMYKLCESLSICRKMAIENQDTAILMGELQGIIFMRQSYNSEKKKNRMVPIDATVYQAYLGIEIIAHGCLLHKRVEELMHRLFSAGLSRRVLDNEIRNERILYSELINDDPFVLTLQHLQGAFYLILIGILLALIVFSSEILIFYSKS
ncbi:Ionotropic receptor 436 [Blattella germanica]|nr:Ionotropic receptor 436 [Blattella germanica]